MKLDPRKWTTNIDGVRILAEIYVAKNSTKDKQRKFKLPKSNLRPFLFMDVVWIKFFFRLVFTCWMSQRNDIKRDDI